VSDNINKDVLQQILDAIRIQHKESSNCTCLACSTLKPTTSPAEVKIKKEGPKIEESENSKEGSTPRIKTTTIKNSSTASAGASTTSNSTSTNKYSSKNKSTSYVSAPNNKQLISKKTLLEELDLSATSSDEEPPTKKWVLKPKLCPLSVNCIPCFWIRSNPSTGPVKDTSSRQIEPPTPRRPREPSTPERLEIAKKRKVNSKLIVEGRKRRAEFLKKSIWDHLILGGSEHQQQPHTSAGTSSHADCLPTKTNTNTSTHYSKGREKERGGRQTTYRISSTQRPSGSKKYSIS